MAMQNYMTAPPRVLIKAAQDMLEHAQPIIVLGDFGVQKEMPKNSTDTLVFRRTLPFGASVTGSGIDNQQYVGTPVVNPSTMILAEGTTPNPNTISFQDVSVTLQNVGILFKFSSKADLMHEQDIPSELSKICGETMAECLELMRYGVLKAGTQVVYSNGSARSSVNSPISLNKLRISTRILESNRARRVTQRLAPSVNFGTRAIPAAYVVFCHTDCESDIRNLPGFTRVEDYGSFKPIHAREIGSCEQYRFITSPLLSSFAGAGSSTLNGMASTGAGTNTDVYPYLVIAEDAWGQVALRGQRAVTPRVIPASTISHANPLGMYGFVGASTWFAAVRLNEANMVRIEAGVTAL
jgi:N4-gp56 family major capsid protein